MVLKSVARCCAWDPCPQPRPAHDIAGEAMNMEEVTVHRLLDLGHFRKRYIEALLNSADDLTDRVVLPQDNHACSAGPDE